jgi:hypothetical protein
MRTTLKTVFAYLVFVAWGHSVFTLWTMFPGNQPSDPKWGRYLFFVTSVWAALFGGYYILRQFGCGPWKDKEFAKPTRTFGLNIFAARADSSAPPARDIAEDEGKSRQHPYAGIR